MSLTHLVTISVSASLRYWNIPKTSQCVRMVLLMLVCCNPSRLVLRLMNEGKESYIQSLAASNRTLRNFTRKLKSIQKWLVLYTMKCIIPDILNDDLDFFFADHIILFFCKYMDLDSIRSHPNLSTQLVDADTSVNLGGVNISSLRSQSGKDVRYNLVAKYFGSLAEGLGRVLCNRVHNVLSIYQSQSVPVSICR